MTAGRTHEELLNTATVPTTIASSLAQLATVEDGEVTSGFGSFLRAMTPGLVVRTGLPSQVTHKEALPGRIFAVTDEAGAVNIPIVYAGAPGVGEVLVEYDVSGTEPGIPTLTFQAAVTGYQVEKAELAAGWDETLAAIGS